MVAMVFYDVDRMLMRAKKKIVTTRIMSHVCARQCSTVSKHVDVLSGDIAGARERCRRGAHAIRYLPTKTSHPDSCPKDAIVMPSLPADLKPSFAMCALGSPS